VSAVILFSDPEVHRRACYNARELKHMMRGRN
jgi:hypothetical protein